MTPDGDASKPKPVLLISDRTGSEMQVIDLRLLVNRKQGEVGPIVHAETATGKEGGASVEDVGEHLTERPDSYSVILVSILYREHIGHIKDIAGAPPVVCYGFIDRKNLADPLAQEVPYVDISDDSLGDAVSKALASAATVGA